MTAIPLFYGHTGSHRKPRRARLRHTLGALAARLWGWLATFETPAPRVPEPIVTDAEVREEFERMPLERPGDTDLTDETRQWYTVVAPVPMSPDPAVKPGVGWRVPDGYQLPGGRGLMFARPGKQPWPTSSMPALPAPPVPAVPDPGDGLTDIPLVPCHGQLVYNQACQLDVDEAERRFALAHGPDGCEVVS